MGEQVAIAGPRSGGFAPPADTDWMMLAGDASALPAMQSIAASLPGSARVKAYVEIVDDGECQPMDSAANWRTEWITAAPGQPGQRLCQRLMYRPLPLGTGYLWMAGESGAMRTLKMHFPGPWHRPHPAEHQGLLEIRRGGPQGSLEPLGLRTQLFPPSTAPHPPGNHPDAGCRRSLESKNEL